MAELKIGQVAKLVGVGIDTVRYYERRGFRRGHLAGPPGIACSTTPPSSASALIKQLQDLGLTLQEIDAMLRASGEHATCAHESDKIRAALARTEEKIAALTAVRTKLQRALDRCSRGECTIMVQVSAVQQRSTVRLRRAP